MTTRPTGRDVPRTSIILGLVLCGAGLAVAIYLTIEHFSTTMTLACPESARINCQRVTTSQYSHLAGIPVAVLGLLYFVVAVLLLTPQAWRSSSATVRWARIGWVTLGLVTVIYLVWAEFFGVNAICLWCTSVHLITFALFVLVALTEAWVLPTDPAARP
ncbi:MAG: vitamin K epoxide reductase family protein [Nocardioides sp.]